MTPYRKPDRRVWNIVVATDDPATPYIRPSTGTHDRGTALAMEAMLRAEGVPIRAGYTLHNARSSFAVEMLKRGEEPELIRRNMGLASMALLLKLYGKYRPRTEDVARAVSRRAAQ